MATPALQSIPYSIEAFRAVLREYERSSRVNMNELEPDQRLATKISEALTAKRELYLQVAFQEAFGEMIELRGLALCAAGGTATRSTARFSDVDLFIVADARVSDSSEYRDALQRFRDILQRDHFHCDIQTHEPGGVFDTSHLQRISSREKRELAEVKAAESYLSLLPARLLCGSEGAFASFRESYRASLKSDRSPLLSLWLKSVLLRWEQNVHPFDSAEFDIKSSKGALRECDVLENLHSLCEATQSEKPLILPEELQRMRELREGLLRLKHQMHFLPPEGGRTPNPEDRAFTTCTYEKLATIAGSVARRHRRFGEISSIREELGRMSARIQRRVVDHLHGVQSSLEELEVDPFMSAYAKFKKECYSDAPRDHRVVEATIGVFCAWRERLGKVEPRKILRNLSSLEHEVLFDLSRLAETLGGDAEREWLGAARTALRPIFEASGARSPVLELLHRSGWLSILVPEFKVAQSTLTDRRDDPVSHARHALDVVRELDHLLGHLGTLDVSHPHHALTQRFIEQPEILYLAALCHDLGHVSPDHPKRKGHEERGAADAYLTASSLGYSHNESFRVAWLVRNHHKLRRIARLAATSEELIGKRVSESVLDPDSLVMLYALSAADYIAGPSQRNDRAMHQWIARAFRAGDEAMMLGTRLRDTAEVVRRIAQDFGRALQLSTSNAMERVQSHINDLPPSYVGELSTEEIVHHVIGASSVDLPYIHWLHEGNEEDGGATSTRLQRVVVVARDQAGLLSKMCGGIPFPITEARVFTTKHGVACNVITCAVPRTMLTSDLIRYTSRLKGSLCDVALPSATFVQEYRGALERAGPPT